MGDVWGYLTGVPDADEVFGLFAILYLILFGVGFLAAVAVYNGAGRRFGGHGLKRRTAQRAAAIAMAVFGVGLFFFAIGALQINPFGLGMRLWLWLSLLAAVAMIAYFVYYLRTTYPARLVAYEQQRRKAQYLRPAAAAAGRTGNTRAARVERQRGRRRRR